MAGKNYSEQTKPLRSLLRSCRVAQGLSMRDLAGKLGVHHSCIGRVELGETKLDILEYARYCHALNINASEGMRLLEKYIPFLEDIARSPAKCMEPPIMNTYGTHVWPPDSKQSRVFPKREPPISGD